MTPSKTTESDSAHPELSYASQAIGYFISRGCIAETLRGYGGCFIRISGCRSAKLLASPNALVSLEIPDVE